MSLPCSATDSKVAEKSRQLKELRSRIDRLQQSFASTEQQKSQAVGAMRDIERLISQTVTRLRAIDAQVKNMQHELQQLESDRARHSTLLAAQRQRLVLVMQSAYAMGKQRHLKLVLNQQKSEQVGRMLTYSGYLSKAHASSMVEVKLSLQALQSTETSITERLADLQDLRQLEVAERDRLDQHIQERKVLVSNLSKELEKQGGRLSRLAADEKQLTKLIDSLRQTLADIPLQRQQGPFKSLKGKLVWPARGLLENSFGTKLPGTGIKSGGVLIKAPEGGQVRSVSQGRVAFADWIRGYGLLLIIDHGDGYMTLYGHNQALYKEVGEWVDTGEVIAAVGRSGGRATSGLYFELRFKGQPVNPGIWCAGKPKAGSG